MVLYKNLLIKLNGLEDMKVVLDVPCINNTLLSLQCAKEEEILKASYLELPWVGFIILIMSEYFGFPSTQIE